MRSHYQEQAFASGVTHVIAERARYTGIKNSLCVILEPRILCAKFHPDTFKPVRRYE